MMDRAAEVLGLDALLALEQPRQDVVQVRIGKSIVYSQHLRGAPIDAVAAQQ